MTCCGGKIKQAVGIVSAGIEKTATIVKGNTLLAMNQLFILPKEKYEYADVRLAICRQCEKCTWLTMAEYLAFLNEHKIEVIKNIADLTVFPELPKHEYEKGRKLFCMLCKCWLPAKDYVKTEKCPLDKWRE